MFFAQAKKRQAGSSNFTKKVLEASIEASTDYRHPMRAFFQKSRNLALGRHFGLKCFEAFGVFSAGLSAPILVM